MDTELIDKLQDYFERYPQSEEVYVTDGLLFHKRGMAESYGSGEAKRYTRKEVEATTTEPAGKGDGSLTPEALGEQLKSGAIEVDSLSYEQMKEYVQMLGLETADQKKATFAEALKALAEGKQEEA